MPDEIIYHESDLYRAQAAALSDYSAAPNLKNAGGNLHLLHVQVTLASTAANVQVLSLAYLPPGAKVIPALSKVQCPTAVGTAFNLDIGTTAVSEAFAKYIAITSNGTVAFDSAVPLANGQALKPEKTTKSTLVKATIKNKGTIVNNTVLTFFIAYTLG